VTDPAQQIDITTRVVNSAVEHWPFIVGILVSVWKVTPIAMKAYFANGGGIMLREAVSAENKLQSEKFQAMITAHEQMEMRRFREGEERMEDIEADLQAVAEGANPFRSDERNRRITRRRRRTA
jgi:hypothetical protein